ncbi:hypothetical protein ACE41H_24480 [Paenibacillus enshidis]|uniref:Uncharacterized protein n=1 Tax=Paenibacillus enshidis TaxID=1458439 RepID=A0ABV5B0A3_9BACL
MMQWIKFVVMGILFWLIAFVFFRFLGIYVLLGPQESYFTTFLLLMLVVILLLFGGLSLFVRLRMYRAKGAATRFGHWLAFTGLVLNGFIVWYRNVVFPPFSPGQHEAYTICIIFACALALLIPSIMDRLIRAPKPEFQFSRDVNNDAEPDKTPKTSTLNTDILDEHKDDTWEEHNPSDPTPPKGTIP